MEGLSQKYIKKLARAGLVLLWVLAVFVLVLALNAIKENRFIGGGVPSSNTISVSGEGEVFAVPDTAQFSFSVTAEAATMEEAQSVAAEKTNNILEYLEDEDVEEEDIKTTNYSVYPRYEYRRGPQPLPAMKIEGEFGEGFGATEPAFYPNPDRTRVLVGFEVTQSVQVSVRDTEVAGTLLSGVGERGATNISGLTFTVDDEEGLQKEARKMAINDARDKARGLARDLDVDLVRIVSFSEGGNYPTPFYARTTLDTAAEESVVPEIPVGENRIVSSVTITYEIR